MRREDTLLEAFMILSLCLVVAFFVWLHFFGPCEWTSWMKAGDVPVRCMPGYGR